MLGNIFEWPAERLPRKGGRVEMERVYSSGISRAALEERIRREGFAAIARTLVWVGLSGWQEERIAASPRAKPLKCSEYG